MKDKTRLKIELRNGEKFIFEPGEWEDVRNDNGLIGVFKDGFSKLTINKDVLFIIEFEEAEPLKKSPVSGWIPIDEKRPAPEEEVLVCNVHGVIFIGERADFLGKNIFVDSVKTISTKAAAWMPLPEKYKGAVDNG